MLASAPRLQTRPASSWARWCVMAVAVLVAGVAAWTAFGGATGDVPLSAQAQQARAAAFAQTGALHVPVVAADERAAVLASFGLPAAQTQLLTAQLDAGALRLVWLTLWDDRTEDGDTVAVESAGVGRTVRLTHAAQRIALPVAPDGTIVVRGVYDGGGGITVAAMTDGATVPLPVMAVGQVIGLQVTP